MVSKMTSSNRLSPVIVFLITLFPTPTPDGRFVLENFFLDKHVRYILIIYPVVIWALTGSYTKNYDPASPSQTGIFAGEEILFLSFFCIGK